MSGVLLTICGKLYLLYFVISAVTGSSDLFELNKIQYNKIKISDTLQIHVVS